MNQDRMAKQPEALGAVQQTEQARGSRTKWDCHSAVLCGKLSESGCEKMKRAVTIRKSSPNCFVVMVTQLCITLKHHCGGWNGWHYWESDRNESISGETETGKRLSRSKTRPCNCPLAWKWTSYFWFFYSLPHDQLAKDPLPDWQKQMKSDMRFLSSFVSG